MLAYACPAACRSAIDILYNGDALFESRSVCFSRHAAGESARTLAHKVPTRETPLHYFYLWRVRVAERRA